MSIKTGRALSVLTKVRVLQPFIDEDIVPFTFTIPDDWKVRGKVPKVIIRELQSRYIPKHLITIDKLGMVSKINHWIRHNKSLSRGEELLRDHTTVERGLYDRKSLEAILAGYKDDTGNIGYAQLYYMLLQMELWCRAFLNKKRVSF